MTNLEKQAQEAWGLCMKARHPANNREMLTATGQLQKVESSNPHIQKITGNGPPVVPAPDGGGNVA